MAWYFLMVASHVVPISVGEQVKQPPDDGFDYLPEYDAELVRAWAWAWASKPYRF